MGVLGALPYVAPQPAEAQKEVVVRDTFPVLPDNPNLLFYVQRSSNISTIVYELNRTPTGKLNSSDPVHIFWILYAKDSLKDELSYVQRNFAYGLNFKRIAGGAYEISFVSYKKLKLDLRYSDADRRYGVYTQFNGKRIKVKRFFVSVNGGTFWVPRIDYIEIDGLDTATGRETVERFKP